MESLAFLILPSAVELTMIYVMLSQKFIVLWWHFMSGRRSYHDTDIDIYDIWLAMMMFQADCFHRSMLCINQIIKILNMSLNTEDVWDLFYERNLI